MKSFPSIFNDVIGPVMRGPSSSHCAASLRIGRLCRDLMDGDITDILVEFDPKGSLATTHESQGSDMGLFGGFLGWEADDERLPDSARFLGEAGVRTAIEIADIGAAHPNTYHIILTNKKESRRLTAISTGGGMIQVIAIDGAKVSMAGDFYETLVYCSRPDDIAGIISCIGDWDEVSVHEGDLSFVEIKGRSFPHQETLEELSRMKEVLFVKKLAPVLPVLSSKDMQVPFTTCAEMLDFNKERKLELWQLGVAYESARGGMAAGQVLEKMTSIVQIMQRSIQEGLKGTSYSDRLLGSQSVNFRRKLETGKLLEAGALNTVVMYVSAMMEVKSSMGVIVAAPTAGSCAALPGALIGTAAFLGLPEETIVRAMLAAGVIGLFVSARATFAAEVGGCQAECGSAAGMAAAGLVQMAGGTLEQSLAAASLALQSSLGLICTPIANRVEAPCLSNNVVAASNALSCANMGLSDYNHLIPLDEVIETMDRIGKGMPHELRCTNLGGLSVTPAAKELEIKLNEQRQAPGNC